MEKNTNKSSMPKIVGIVVALILILGGGYWFASREQTQPEPAKPKTSQTQTKKADTKPGYIKYQGEEGKTALAILKTKADVKTEDSDFGEFVKSINGEDGGGTKYWIFYVNGQEASEGAGTYQTKSSDTIEWKLQ